MATHDDELDPSRLPVRFDPVSNGEFLPLPMSATMRRAKALALDALAENARRRGMARREFLKTAAAAATCLGAINVATGCATRSDAGRFALAKDAGVDDAAAKSTLAGNEFIFDVQTHHVDPDRPWKNPVFDFLKRTPQATCGEENWKDCYSQEAFIKEIFLDSDTDMAVLSALAGTDTSIPIEVEEMAATRDAVDKLGRERLMIHGIVLPNRGPVKESLERMQDMKETWKVDAWKLYTIWGPDGRGFWLDDERLGIPVLERAQSLGVTRVAVHKGIPLATLDPTFTRCRDVGVVAKRFPGLQFLVYHAGYEHAVTEGPRDPSATVGIDGLLHSMEAHGIGAGQNVFAELGSTWYALMRKPGEAAHAIGKLLVHVGEDNVLWGTDAIWYGSPQEQIQAFRAFEIPEAMQEKFGYPALTPARKAKILGLNGARAYGVNVPKRKAELEHDALGRARQAYREDPDPSFRSYGPRTVEEVLAHRRAHGGLPG